MELVLWLVVGAVTLMLAVSTFLWIQSELDERRWRRKLREEQMRVVIRQHRYGTRAGGRNE